LNKHGGFEMKKFGITWKLTGYMIIEAENETNAKAEFVFKKTTKEILEGHDEDFEVYDIEEL